ncbi:putative uncharacterized protein encoded by LINC00614 [Pongo pygmaeus]|uniref:putative uncharacterized protein encoded by LINC00614 n=1 Tax=Pongo pygmaeus TaxID=9600 RepID=UPI0023E335AD|nr:putative uncharacterized protein encoded by LINC00614 [Pongo pygmaeus]
MPNTVKELSFPYSSSKGEGIDDFWQVLMEGRNYTVEILPERLNFEGWFDADDTKPGKSRAGRAASIERLNEFDNNLFGISDLEAECLDPQQKLLLECTYRALESAGVPAKEVAGSRTGVFIDIMNQDYEFMSRRTPRTQTTIMPLDLQRA